MKKLLARWPEGPMGAGLLLALATILAFAPDQFLLMMARAFLLQWSIAFVLLALVAAVTRRWWTLAAALVSAVLVLLPPLRTIQEAAVPESGPELLRVAQLNVLQPNRHHADVIAAALGSNADVLSFQEVSPAWSAALEQGLAARYPYHTAVPGTNCYGIALFSRLPFDAVHVRRSGRRPFVDAVVRTPQGPVRVLAVHTASPGSMSSFAARNHTLQELAELTRDPELSTILIGDLNTVPWDSAFQHLCRRGGLREEAQGERATWPSALGCALIPLDHILTTGHLYASARSTFRIPGSDHRGLVATIHRRS